MQELKKFRLSLGLTMKEIAENIGISKSFYEKVEMGHKNMSSNFAKKLKSKYPQLDLNIFFTNKVHK